MRTPFFAAAVLAAPLLFAQTKELKVEPTDSKLLWTASKVTGEHTGTVPIGAGTIALADGRLAGAEVTMDMTGITCIDIQNESTNAKFVGHLRSADFFDVEKHGTATFKATRVEVLPDVPAGKPNYRVTGDLTIKGISQPNTFDCLFWVDGDKARAAANLTIDRTLYEIKYRSGNYFQDLGDKAISDTVQLTFDITAR